MRKAGISKKLTTHAFRRSIANHLLLKNIDIRYIQKILHHDSLESTIKYLEVDNDEMRKMVETCHPMERL